jgi:ferritin
LLSDKMQKALNEQINAELHSAYLYLSMSSYFSALNLDGGASWMRLQAQEELLHGMRFYDYMVMAGGRIELLPIAAVPRDFSSPMAAFEAALGHERKMTSRINDLVGLAHSEKDHATGNQLQWFVTEQVEEEANVERIVARLKLAGQDGPGLFMVDRELGERASSPAPTE